MKIAIVGSSGYIARYLTDRLKSENEIDSILEIDHSNADFFLELLNAETFDYEVLNDIDYIVFTAAISGPDQCAKEFQKCWDINVKGTSFFIRQALSRNCKVLFFSSDAVFGGDLGKAFHEESPACAVTAYGQMKKAVEDTFKFENGFKAIRLSYVPSSHDKFVKYCLECVRNGSQAEVFHPFYRNCITLTEVGNIVAWLLFHWESYPHPFLNAAGSELVSRVHLVDELIRQTGKSLKYSVTMPDETFFENRPKITQMESRYLYSYGILEVKSFAERFQTELEGVVI